MDIIQIREKVALNALNNFSQRFKTRLIHIHYIEFNSIRCSIRVPKAKGRVRTNVTVENWCSDQEGQQCVEKDVEKLDKFFCLCPNDIHDGLFEVFLIDLTVMMMMVMVVMLMMRIRLLS